MLIDGDNLVAIVDPVKSMYLKDYHPKLEHCSVRQRLSSCLREVVLSNYAMLSNLGGPCRCLAENTVDCWERFKER
jgi:hypothetical protein